MGSGNIKSLVCMGGWAVGGGVEGDEAGEATCGVVCDTGFDV
jgi:hypothetical protein